MASIEPAHSETQQKYTITKLFHTNTHKIYAMFYNMPLSASLTGVFVVIPIISRMVKLENIPGEYVDDCIIPEDIYKLMDARKAVNERNWPLILRDTLSHASAHSSFAYILQSTCGLHFELWDYTRLTLDQQIQKRIELEQMFFLYEIAHSTNEFPGMFTLMNTYISGEYETKKTLYIVTQGGFVRVSDITGLNYDEISHIYIQICRIIIYLMSADIYISFSEKNFGYDRHTQIVTLLSLTDKLTDKLATDKDFPTCAPHTITKKMYSKYAVSNILKMFYAHITDSSTRRFNYPVRFILEGLMRSFIPEIAKNIYKAYFANAEEFTIENIIEFPNFESKCKQFPLIKCSKTFDYPKPCSSSEEFDEIVLLIEHGRRSHLQLPPIIV